MSIIEAIVLSFVQGVTTFLPVSSMGHLLLTRSVFGVADTTTLLFQSVLYFATAAALIVYFFSDLWILIQVALRKLGRLPVNVSDEVLLYSLLLASVPVVLLGLTLESWIGGFFNSPLLVAGVLFGGSLLFMYAEWVHHTTPRTNMMYPLKGLQIGLFQTLALMPGVSRLGGAIAGGVLLGLSRTEATRFAFLIAIPLLLGIGIQKFIQMLSLSEPVTVIPLIIAGGVTFFVSLFTIRFMMRFMQRHTLWPFIWYRIILAGFVVFVTVFG